MSQDADDITIILDGSEKSLQNLNVWTAKFFSNMSGLKINQSKTQLVWIGSKNILITNYAKKLN